MKRKPKKRTRVPAQVQEPQHLSDNQKRLVRQLEHGATKRATLSAGDKGRPDRREVFLRARLKKEIARVSGPIRRLLFSLDFHKTTPHERESHCDQVKDTFLDSKWFLIMTSSFMITAVAIVIRSSDTKADTKAEGWGFRLTTSSTAVAFGALGFFGLLAASRSRKQHSTQQHRENSQVQNPPNEHIPSKSKPLQRESEPSDATPKLLDCGYVVLSRTIYSCYSDRVNCVTTHDAEIKATRDYVTLYEGRYRPRSKQNGDLIVRSPYKRLMFDELDMGFKKFHVELKSPLLFDCTTKVISEVSWEDDLPGEYRESVVALFAHTEKLLFVVFPPNRTRIIEATGTIRQHPGDHPYISQEALTPHNNILLWEPDHLMPFVHYRLSWKWALV